MSRLSDAVEIEWASMKGPGCNPRMWDKGSARFAEHPIPEVVTDDFLRLVSQTVRFEGSESVLDVGCGAGQYSIALSHLSKKVLGTDFSESMVAHARLLAEREGANNVVFERSDWMAQDVSMPGYSDGFDVTIAHCTPAIGSADSFRKLVSVTNGWGFVTFCTRRVDVIDRKLGDFVGREFRNAHGADLPAYAFQVLWDLGIYPLMHYERDVTTTGRMPSAEALDRVRGMLARSGEDDPDALAKRFVDSISENGEVDSGFRSDFTTVYWDAGSKA
ncbi:MAG: methyltransferase domain-containing protein [Candidatus Methanomethylophilaceae archaeon]|nr:methyltransferase domain-containing protein [Candidatus Methanomethylophilaceae archaeon]